MSQHLFRLVLLSPVLLFTSAFAQEELIIPPEATVLEIEEPIVNPPVVEGEVAPGLVPSWDYAGLAALQESDFASDASAAFFGNVLDDEYMIDSSSAAVRAPQATTKRELSRDEQMVAEVLSELMPPSQDLVIGGSDPGNGVIQRPGYDYVPSILFDEGKYKIWWCSNNNQTPDNIWYATATNIADKNTYVIQNNNQPVFKPLYPNCNPNSLSSPFDCLHTCDPSVIKIKGTYYMYYTGFPVVGPVDVPPGGNARTKIGLAVSVNGVNWSRPYSSAIIDPVSQSTFAFPDAQNVTRPVFFYGAGQPSVTFAGGKFYLTFFDDTVNTYTMSGVTTYEAAVAAAANAPKSQFAIRSADPSFKTGVEEYRAGGVWVSIPNNTQPTRTDFYLPHSVSVDWSYAPRTREFVVSANRTLNYNTTLFFDATLAGNPRSQLDVFAPWNEGPGIARYANGQLIHSGLCEDYWFNILRSDGTYPLSAAPYIADLFHVGFTFPTGRFSCLYNTHDYDGDGVSDQIVYRSTQGRYYVQTDSTGISQTNLVTGNASDIPFKGDFDGDGKTDFGVIQVSGGYYNWTIMRSSNPTQPVFQPTWGITGDLLAVSDYDGDGKDDIGVYRQGTVDGQGTFYYIKSSNQLGYSRVYGGPYQLPVMSDFDGDGMVDTALYYWPLGVWNILVSSTGGHLSTNFRGGEAGDVPLSGDFLGGPDGFGDGIPDFVIWRPSNGTWYLDKYEYPTFSVHVTQQWGLPGDIPVVADSNGDGILDYVVYRPSEGKWYIKFRGATLPDKVVQWGGLAGDKIPANQVARRARGQ